jgi:hypothetical protein
LTDNGSNIGTAESWAADTLKRILDDIAEILAKTDVRSLLREQKAGDPGSLFIRKFFGGI